MAGDGFNRDEILKLWKEIEAVQKALGEKIPPRVVRLTERANEVLAREFPELRVVDASEEPWLYAPRVDLLCKDCGAETRLLRDDPLSHPRPHCPACGWTGYANPANTVVRLGAGP